MELWTVLGGALLVWAAYKLGVYVEGKMKAKLEALESKPDAEPDPAQPDSERKR